MSSIIKWLVDVTAVCGGAACLLSLLESLYDFPTTHVWKLAKIFIFLTVLGFVSIIVTTILWQ